jgi:hypothetical protein
MIRTIPICAAFRADADVNQGGGSVPLKMCPRYGNYSRANSNANSESVLAQISDQTLTRRQASIVGTCGRALYRFFFVSTGCGLWLTENARTSVPMRANGLTRARPVVPRALHWPYSKRADGSLAFN